MRKSIVLILTMWTLPAFAVGLQEYGVEAINAANLVLKPGVQKCLQTFTRGGGVPQIDQIDYVSNIDREVYLLKGTTTFGDLMGGSWDITVTPHHSDENTWYSCQITNNQE